MILAATAFITMSLFILARIPRGVQAIWLGAMLFSFALEILGLLGLVSKFGNYHLSGFLVLPPGRPEWLWRILLSLPLSSLTRFRLFGAAGFIISTVGFAVSYSRLRSRASQAMMYLFGVALSLHILVYYDPNFIFRLYKAGASLASQLARLDSYRRWLQRIDLFGMSMVIALLAASIVLIADVLARSSIRQKRAQAVCVLIGTGILCFFFVVMFCVGPASILSSSVSATSLLPIINYPVVDNTFLEAVPIAAALSVAAVSLSILQYGFLGAWRIGAMDLDRQINLANQAVRLALHSFKNRFLAIQLAMNMSNKDLDGIDLAEVINARQRILWAQEICHEALAQLETLHTQSTRVTVHPAPLRWGDLIVDVLRKSGEQRKDISITTRVFDDETVVWGDRYHLTAVLENLLQNAIDVLRSAGESGGRVDIEVGREHEWGYIRITDNGPGIPKGQINRIFTPFYTTKPTTTNWGLGLTYCHRVIRAHRGFINVKSRRGRGTTMEVVLRCRENVDIPLSASPEISASVQKRSS